MTQPTDLDRLEQASTASTGEALIAAAHIPTLIAELRQLRAERGRMCEASCLLEWLGEHPGIELSYAAYSDDGEQWQVHRVNGGRNDREWTLLADEESPLLALRKARAALGGEHDR